MGLNMLYHIKDFFYPRFCVICDKPLKQSETELCLLCEINLPHLPYKLGKQNPIERVFRNRINISGASSFLPYIEEGTAQKLIHALKYKGHKELGIVLGKKAAEHLKERNPDYNPDLIIPVPLHFSKKRKRGYNQCALLAQGMNEIFQSKVFYDVRRNVETKSQTKKSRYDRFVNMSNIFEVTNPAKIKGKKVLILDDVITTGATLYSFAQEIKKHNPLSINIYSISCRL